MEELIENVLFEFYRGDTYQRVFSVDWNREIDNVYFTVKENVENKSFVLQKKLNDGITPMDKVDNTSTFNLSICCTDTDRLKADYDYVFDIEVHSKGTEATIKKTIITGILRLKASSTKTCNEC